MIRPLTIALMLSAVLAEVSISRADPITYNFSGTFDRPMNGTDQFSGSFTFNPDPTPKNLGEVGVTQVVVEQGTNAIRVAHPVAYSFIPNSGPPVFAGGPVTEYGDDLSLTVRMGGQVIHYLNTAQNPFAATFRATSNYPTPYPGQGPPVAMDRVLISGVTANYRPGNSFSNSSFDIGFSGIADTIFQGLAPGQVAKLGRFDFTKAIIGLDAADPSGGLYYGKITSIQRVTTPEPLTLVYFACLGIVGRIGRSRRSR